jgi:hypothetical protein
MTSVDNQGTREVQAMMETEVKTRSGNLTQSQVDTYRKKHAMTMPYLQFRGQAIFNYGVSFVRMDRTSPLDSTTLEWGRFNRHSDFQIIWKNIACEQLIKLMRFELNPDTLLANSYRRHHKTRKVLLSEEMPLGFVAERELIARS